MGKTTIEWTDYTFNPWIGCTKVSPGCDHCYAEARMDTRLHRVTWGAGQPRQRTKTWGDPIRWNKAHEAFYAAHGRRQRVFCASLADVFDNEVPIAWRAELFDLIRRCDKLDFLLLTKRIGNAVDMLPWAMRGAPGNMVAGSAIWPNVWIGATIVNQAEADRDIPKLLRVPAHRRFLSCEPLLGPLQLWRLKTLDFEEDPEGAEVYPLRGLYAVPDCDWPGPKLDWVIAGGESGPGARPMQMQWARDIVRQCREAGVPVLVKQLGREVLDDGMSSPGEHWPMSTVRQPAPGYAVSRDPNAPGFVVRLQDRKGGDWSEWPEDLRVRQFPEASHA